MRRIKIAGMSIFISGLIANGLRYEIGMFFFYDGDDRLTFWLIMSAIVYGALLLILAYGKAVPAMNLDEQSLPQEGNCHHGGPAKTCPACRRTKISGRYYRFRPLP